ncbi:pseudouridine synthase [Alkaliphilus metalliredigens QYMF]|uniref:Pseudouridine synthase n=1 Tax=Alkaliphilus metalliredigens (strain QYMF) TaxID=293826 RepID=A6TUC4_ALKMQ|nr:pseudouridine synthase [Alkaliphilus metalliredigens]ABR49792.1 pseudouridine synthase [Alkaliphilus metalliredigens QYMF]
MAKTQRLDKILANLGHGSRSDIRRLCRQGVVTVNGAVVKSSSQHVEPENDKITVGEEEIYYREFVYIMMNKPQDVISATEDFKEKTVVDLLESKYQAFDVFPVGRLDKDTEGLLMLTNDGKLAHQLLSPKKHVPKTYYAKIEGVVTDADVEAFEKGIFIEENLQTMPSQLKILKADEISEVEVTIYEGKYHQVKRMFQATDKEVVYLKRLSMGSLMLDNSLDLGTYRELSEEELQGLKNGDKI